MSKPIVVTFLGEQCEVSFAHYNNGRRAIELTIQESGEPMAVASVNLPDEPIEDDEVAIKNYSENEGILEVLIHANVISEPLREVDLGFVTVPICKLLINS